MKKNYYRLVFGIAVCLLTMGKAQAQSVWQERLIGGGNGFEVCNAHGGGFVAASIPGTPDDFALTRVGADGSYVDHVYITDGSWWSQAYDIKATSDGGYIAAGYSAGGGIGAGDAVLVKLDANLDVTWRGSYGTSDLREAAYSVVEVEDGYVFTGESGGGGDGSVQLPIAKVDFSGNLIWSKLYIDNAQAQGHPSGHTIITTKDGGFAIAASWGAYPAIYDMVLAKFDASGDYQWIKAYGEHGTMGSGADLEESFSLVETDDEGFALAGRAAVPGSGDQVFLVRTDASGNAVFQRLYGTTNGDESAEDIVLTPDGDFVLSGQSNSKMLLMKILSNGSMLWAFEYNNHDIGYGLCLAPDNGFAVVGSSAWDDLTITKTDVNGFTGCERTPLTFSVNDLGEDPIDITDFVDQYDWDDDLDAPSADEDPITPTFDCCDIGLTCAPILPNLSQVHKYIGLEDRHDYGQDIKQMANGGYIVAGYDEVPGSPATDRDATLTELDEAGRWCWTVNYELGDDEWAYAVEPLTNEECGGIVLAGARKSTGALDMLVIKTDGAGGPYWMTAIGGNRDEVAYDIIEVAGGYVAAGYTETYGQGDKDIYVVKIDQVGAVQWTRVLGVDEDDVAYGLWEADNGDVLVTGFTEKNGLSAEFFLARLAPLTGAIIWEKRIGHDNWEEFGYDVWENPVNGYIYVAGSGRGGTGNQLDPMLLITDGSGNPLSRVRFPNTELDEVFSISPNQAGNLYLAGYTRSTGAADRDALVIECELDGTFVGAMWYGDNGQDVARSIFTNAANRPVVIGETNSFGNGYYDMYFLKLNNLLTSCYEDEITYFPDAIVPDKKGSLDTTMDGTPYSPSGTPDNLIEIQVTICDYEENPGSGGGTDKRAPVAQAAAAMAGEWAITAFPNPNAGRMRFELNKPTDALIQLTIMDATGKIVLNRSTTLTQGEIDLGALGDGLYFLVAEDGASRAVCKFQLIRN